MESSRERILFVAREFTRGGAACLALRHMRRLLPHYEIDLLVTGSGEEAMFRQLPQEVSVFKLDEDSMEPDAEAQCGEFLLKHREAPPFQRAYCAVLATSVFPSWHACAAVSSVHAAKKLVFLVDEGLAWYPRLSPAGRNAFDGCLAAASLVVPVSRRLWQRMADACPALAQCPWQVLRTPVDAENIILQSRGPAPDWGLRDTPVVLTVARLSPDKQIWQSLHIHHRLRQAGIEFRWVVVGAGPDEATLRAGIDRLGMTDAFILAGTQEHVYAWMKHCDVFALLSSSEGCPTVVIEALLLGRPVIMTDVNGSDELIDHGRTGLIVRNDPGAIADGLSRLVLDPGLRDQFSRNLAADPLIADAARETAWLVEKIEEPVAPVPVPADPKVSILIPAYNHGRYIHRAIASAMMQDFPSFEVIVADDASTDQTEAVARAWASDPRFRYTRNERNLGRVANYRKALEEHARGEWVLMLDGDDHLIAPGFIRRAWESLQRHAGESPVFAQAGHRVHYVQGDGPDVDIAPPIDGPERVMACGEYLHFVFKTGFFTHLGTLYNRKAAIAYGFYTADISSSDMDSLLRLSLEGNVVVMNTIAGCWNQHGANASANLPLEEIAPNVRIFRGIARKAVQRGFTSMAEINRPLTRYEANTLVHLFGRAREKTSRGAPGALKILAIVISINPRLLLHRRMWSSFYRHLRNRVRLFLKPGRGR